jgi:hypothetical protein
MTDPHAKEHVPTREELEREARRLARVRHLTLIRDIGQASVPGPPRAWHDPDPDPQAAA